MRSPVPVRFALAVPVALALAATGARADIAFDSASSATAVASEISFAHTVGARPDRLLVVSVGVPANDAALFVSYRGVPLVPLGAENADPFFPCRTELWALVDPPSGTHPVRVSYARSLGIRAAAVGFAGVSQTAPTGPYVSVRSTGQLVTVEVPSAPGELVLDSMCAYKTGNPPSAIPGPGQTQRWNEVGTSMVLAGSSEAGAATVAMTWNLDQGRSATWAIGAVSLKPAASASDGGTPADGPADTGIADRPPAALDSGAQQDVAAPQDASAPRDGASSPSDVGASFEAGGSPADRPPVTDARPPSEAGDTAAVHLTVGCACGVGAPQSVSFPGFVLVSFLALFVVLDRRR